MIESETEIGKNKVIKTHEAKRYLTQNKNEANQLYLLPSASNSGKNY
jgi:hypothetical protein